MCKLLRFIFVMMIQALSVSVPARATEGAWQPPSEAQEVWHAFLNGESPAMRLLQQVRFTGPGQTTLPPLCYAALANDVPLVKKLLKYGIKPAAALSEDEPNEWVSEFQCVVMFYGENGNAIDETVINIHPETLQLVLAHTRLTELKMAEQYLLFELAMLSDDADMARDFLDHGFPLGWQDEFHNNLLVHALWAQAYQICDLLLDYGVTPIPAAARTVGADADPERLIAHAITLFADDPEKTALLLRIQSKINQAKRATYAI